MARFDLARLFPRDSSPRSLLVLSRIFSREPLCLRMETEDGGRGGRGGWTSKRGMRKEVSPVLKIKS